MPGPAGVEVYGLRQYRDSGGTESWGMETRGMESRGYGNLGYRDSGVQRLGGYGDSGTSHILPKVRPTFDFSRGRCVLLGIRGQLEWLGVPTPMWSVVS